LPPGFAAGPIEWPYPRRFRVGPIVNFGYEDEVLLVTQIRPPASLGLGNRVRIAARAKWLLCKDVCIPEQGNFEISLPISAAPAKADSKHKDSFAKARAKIPVELQDWELKAELQNDIVLLSLNPQTSSRVDLAGLTFFPDHEGWMDNAAPQLLTREGNRFNLQIKTAATRPEILRGVLVAPKGWSSGHNAVEINVPVK